MIRSRKPPPKPSREKQAEMARKHVVSAMRFRLWQAEKIGWPALADSFRRDLKAMGVEA